MHIDENKRIIEYLNNRPIKKYNLGNIKKSIDNETSFILEKIGLPYKCDLLNFTFNDNVSLINDKYLIIGDYGPYGDKIFVDLTNKNVFAAFISENINPNTYYICKSVRCLLQCIIEYEKFIFEFINAERTVFCINETNWANILSEILRSIDPQIVDFTKGYFLGGYIERIESGI